MDLKTFQNNALNYSNRGRAISALMVGMFIFPSCYIYLHLSHFDFQNRLSWGGNTGNIWASVITASASLLPSYVIFILIRWNRGGIIPKFLFIQPTDTELSEYFIWRRSSLSQRLRELNKKLVDDKYFKEIRKVNAEFSELMRHNQYVPEEEIVEPVRKKKKQKRKPRPPHQKKRWKK